jgi:hypothetical protein
MVNMSCFAKVNTMYKRKSQKVQPQNVARKDGTTPGGDVFWKDGILKMERELLKDREPGPWDRWLIPRFARIPPGTRLTEEKMKTIQIGEELRPREREMLFVCLQNREMALAWDRSEMGHIRKEVTPPMKIDTVDHKPWQAPGFAVPKALKKIVDEMLRDRLRNGTLEPCHGPYRNYWFIVEKKDKKYRLINSATRMNKVTIKDAHLPPVPDEFAEEFAGLVIGSYLDWFSGYDQVELDRLCRDMTAIMTDLGLLRQCTILMGATNSVAQFCRVVLRILQDLIPHIAIPFLDDIGVKGPRSRYDDVEVPELPGVRKFVLEHIQNLDRTLADLERAGATLSAVKSMFCMAGLRIVGYVCDAEGRHPDSAKILKILEWTRCDDLTEARAFLGICGYYRIWIEFYSLIAEPIYWLFRKGYVFRWEEKQAEAMEALKDAITSAPALVGIEYGEGAGEIIAAFDASKRGWGAVLMQLDEQKRRHPARYESGIWSPSEMNYDAGKLECKAVLKGLKKFRQYLYGVHFIVEVDAKTLVAQLNRTATDLPGALVTRWIAWIRLFDFDVRHVPGKKNAVADGLSRKPPGPSDLLEEGDDDDIEDFIDSELDFIRVSIRTKPVRARVYPMMTLDGNQATEQQEDEAGDEEQDQLEDMEEEEETEWHPETGEKLRPGYSEESIAIAQYLTTLRKPPHMNRKEFRKFKSMALQFMVHEGHLFRRASKNMPLRRVVDSEEDRAKILQAAHEESGHRGREGTYRRVADRYWWDDLAIKVAKYVKACKGCQMRDGRRMEEALHPTWVSVMWQKVCVDIVYMPRVKGFKYLVLARDDLSGWVEGRPLREKEAKGVARFLFEDIVCRFGLYGKLIVDGGTENKSLVAELTKRYGIRRIQISAYHPQANPVERGHQPIKDSLAKLAEAGKGNWLKNLHACLWADRTTVRASTGVSPFRFNYGYEPIMPIEEEVPGWSFLKWSEVKTTGELLALRTLQLQRRDEDYEEIALRLRRNREQGKENFDDTHVLHSEPFEVGDLVLLHNTMREGDMSREQKMRFRWLGPYRVSEAIPEKGTYVLEELDGAKLGGTVAGNRLKKFHVRETNPISADPDPAWIDPNAVSATDSWHQMRDENESIEGDNQSEEEEETSASTGGSSEDEENANESTDGKRMEKFIGVFIPARV